MPGGMALGSIGSQVGNWELPVRGAGGKVYCLLGISSCLAGKLLLSSRHGTVRSVPTVCGEHWDRNSGGPVAGVGWGYVFGVPVAGGVGVLPTGSVTQSGKTWGPRFWNQVITRTIKTVQVLWGIHREGTKVGVFGNGNK